MPANFAFNPTDGLVNATSYPTKPASETAARQQVQDPMNQLRDFINDILIPSLYTNTNFSATGLTGATQASRYAGATASGAPTNGTFVVGDYVIDRTAVIWICTAAGTPGTWKAAIPSNTALAVSGGSKLQSGTIAAATATNYTTTFPVAFSGTPVITASYFTNGNNTSMSAVVISALSATSVTFFLPTGASGGGVIHWHAIGT